MRLASKLRRSPEKPVNTLNNRFARFFGIALAVAAGQQGALSAQKAAQTGKSVASTSGWQHIVQDGCQFEVPVSWHPAPDGDGLTAPNGSSLTVRAVQILNWSAHKEQIREAFVHLKTVHEDSDHRFWFEIGSEASTVHYIAVRDGASACIGLLEIRATSTPATPAAAATENRIAVSLGPVPVH
jgi:hypothetical protein